MGCYWFVFGLCDIIFRFLGGVGVLVLFCFRSFYLELGDVCWWGEVGDNLIDFNFRYGGWVGEDLKKYFVLELGIFRLSVRCNDFVVISFYFFIVLLSVDCVLDIRNCFIR